MRQTRIICSAFAPLANNPVEQKRALRRNQRPRRWSLAGAAAVIAVSVSPTTAFQAAHLHPSPRRLPPLPNPLHRPRRPTGSTRHWTVTDPDMLLIETSSGRFRSPKQINAMSESVESLENLYFVSPSMDELAVGELVGVSLPANQKKQAAKSPKKSDSANSRSLKSDDAIGNKSNNVNFKGLSSAPGKRLRKTMKSATVAAVGKDGNNKKARSRSSTMPGFSHRHMTGKQRAFRDGIKLIEKRTGKKMTKILNDAEARTKRKQANGSAMYKGSASVPDSLVQFANEIHQVERITPSDEKELGSKTQEAIRLQSLYDNLEESLDREPTDEEWCAAAGKINMEAIRQAIDDGMEAKDRLVTSNLRMVQGVVNIYIRNGLGGQYNAGDMMQEGILALIRAAEKFEPERGFRFSTYAMYWIRAAVKRSHILQSRVINVPQRLHENYKRVLRVEKELKTSLGRDPTPKELGDAVGMSEQQLDRCKTAMAQRCYSLDQKVTNTLKPNNGDDNKNTLNDLVDSRTDDGEYNKLQRLFLREDLIETLNRHLKPHEVDLLLLRFGLEDEKTAQHGLSGPLTIAQVSGVVGLKPDKVRRMINKSLKQLKYLIANEWDDFEKEIP